jgi:molybdopterin molybdotransferase
MRPGKPLMYGRFEGTHVLGLPGNPVSAIVCAHLFLGPLAARLGGSAAAQDIRDGILTAAMKENDKRRDYVRARTELRDGTLHVTPSAIQDSSMLSVMAASDALLIREPHAPPALAGDRCRVLMLR